MLPKGDQGCQSAAQEEALWSLALRDINRLLCFWENLVPNGFSASQTIPNHPNYTDHANLALWAHPTRRRRFLTISLVVCLTACHSLCQERTLAQGWPLRSNRAGGWIHIQIQYACKNYIQYYMVINDSWVFQPVFYLNVLFTYSYQVKLHCADQLDKKTLLPLLPHLQGYDIVVSAT